MPKPKSVGVRAAWILFWATILAAIIGAGALLAHRESTTVTQTANNSPGAIQAGRDVIINPGNQQTNSQVDTSLAKNYDDKFETMTEKRAKAAIAIQEYFLKGDWDKVTNNTDGLDEVLGFFEIMGYDEEHGLVKPEVLHEYFYEDIVAYYQASTGYITMVQKSDGAATYASLKPLYDTMIKLEMEKENTNFNSIQWSKADLIDYFKSETNSVNLKER